MHTETIAEYLKTDFKSFEVTDKIADVQDFFADTAFSHFSVMENNLYLGTLSATAADGFDPFKQISNYRYALDGFSATPALLLMDLLQIFARNKANIVSMLDQDHQYLGYLELQDVATLFSTTNFVREPGDIIIVEKDAVNHSMSQIAQIVESNNAKLLGCFVSESDQTRIQTTLKISTLSINEILQAFRRYEFDIISTHQEDVFIHDLQERSAYLEKYLSM